MSGGGYLGGAGYIPSDGPIPPMRMRFSNGTILENPDHDDVLHAVEVTMTRPNEALWMLRGDGAMLTVRTGDQLELELRFAPAGRGREARAAGEPALEDVADTVCAFAGLEDDWQEHLEWEGAGGSLPRLPMGDEQLKQSYIKMRALWWIAPVLFLLSLPAWYEFGRLTGDSRLEVILTAAVLTGLAVAAHLLGSRCPACSARLGWRSLDICPHCQKELR
jgi:hypothetical protein